MLKLSVKTYVEINDNSTSVDMHGMFYRMFESVFHGFSESSKFLTSLVTGNLRDYLNEAILDTGLERELKILNHEKNELRQYKYSAIRGRETEVPNVAKENVVLKLEFIDKYLPVVYKDLRERIYIFNREIAAFISNPDRRKEELIDNSVFDGLEKKIKNLNDEIDKLSGGDTNGKTTIGRMFGSVNDIQKAIELSYTLVEKFKEKDVKEILNETSGASDYIEKTMTILSRDANIISDKALERLSRNIVLLGNYITLYGKLIFVQYELAKAVKVISRQLI